MKNGFVGPHVRISTGIDGLDDMLGGGLLPGRPYLLVGPPGSGKTIISLQFLLKGIRQGEEVLYVTLDEPPNELKADIRGFPKELERLWVFDAIPDVIRYEKHPFKDIATVRSAERLGSISQGMRQTDEFRSIEIAFSALMQALKMETVKRLYGRMVIDSLTALEYFGMKGFDDIQGAQVFLRFLSELRITTILTIEESPKETILPERMLARGEIHLYEWESERLRMRAIGIEKFRGSAHDVNLHPYRITGHGVDIDTTVSINKDTRELISTPQMPVAIAAKPSDSELALEAEWALLTLLDDVKELVDMGVDADPVRAQLQKAHANLTEMKLEDTFKVLLDARQMVNHLILTHQVSEEFKEKGGGLLTLKRSMEGGPKLTELAHDSGPKGADLNAMMPLLNRLVMMLSTGKSKSVSENLSPELLQRVARTMLTSQKAVDVGVVKPGEEAKEVAKAPPIQATPPTVAPVVQAKEIPKPATPSTTAPQPQVTATPTSVKPQSPTPSSSQPAAAPPREAPQPAATQPVTRPPQSPTETTPLKPAPTVTASPPRPVVAAAPSPAKPQTPPIQRPPLSTPSVVPAGAATKSPQPTAGLPLGAPGTRPPPLSSPLKPPSGQTAQGPPRPPMTPVPGATRPVVPGSMAPSLSGAAKPSSAIPPVKPGPVQSPPPGAPPRIPGLSSTQAAQQRPPPVAQSPETPARPTPPAPSPPPPNPVAPPPASVAAPPPSAPPSGEPPLEAQKVPPPEPTAPPAPTTSPPPAAPAEPPAKEPPAPAVIPSQPASSPPEQKETAPQPVTAESSGPPASATAEVPEAPRVPSPAPTPEVAASPAGEAAVPGLTAPTPAAPAEPGAPATKPKRRAARAPKVPGEEKPKAPRKRKAAAEAAPAAAEGVPAPGGGEATPAAAVAAPKKPRAPRKTATTRKKKVAEADKEEQAEGSGGASPPAGTSGEGPHHEATATESPQNSTKAEEEPASPGENTVASEPQPPQGEGETQKEAPVEPGKPEGAGS